MTIYLLKFYVFYYAAAKEQVLANLANFSYDPINYDFLRSLQIINLFLDQLSETNPRLVQFAAAGICNLITGDIIYLFFIRDKSYMIFVKT